MECKCKFSIKKVDWKKFEKNNVTIALNDLCAKKEKIQPAYIPKHSSNCKKTGYSFDDSK